MTSQFRPVQRMGSRKPSSLDGQFRPRYEHFVPRQPAPEPKVDRSNRCIANDDTCKAYRAKGTEYCAGHLRSQEEVTDDA